MALENIGDLEKGKFIQDSETTSSVRMSYGDAVSNDAFSRFRVSTPTVIFDSMEANGAKDLLFSKNEDGGATITYLANKSAHKFETTTASGDKATRSSKKLAEYVPGTSLMVFCTGIFGAGADKSRQRMGLFDAQNGIFFEQKDGVMGITLRTYTSGSAVDTHYTQSSWNIDTLDGTGISEKTLDKAKTNIYIIDLQWLGVGRIRLAVDIDGVIVPVHQILNANSKTDVYMTTPRLPVTYEVENTDTSTALDDFRMICSSVITEGLPATDPIPRSINNGIVGVGTSTTEAPVISMRLKAAFANNANLRIKDLSTLTTARGDHLFRLYVNPTLTGASFADVDGIAQKDVAASAVSGGTLLASFYSSQLNQIVIDSLTNNQFVLGSEIDGTPDIFTLTAQILTGTDTAYAAIDYEELY
jgi:hypothetical protein